MDGAHLPGHILTALLHGPTGSHLQPAAAGHLHPQHRYGANAVVPKDLRQLSGIIHSVQLGAADEAYPPGQKPAMKIGIGKRRAVRRDQQLRPVKIRGPGGNQLDLYRPVGELALRLPAGS